MSDRGDRAERRQVSRRPATIRLDLAPTTTSPKVAHAAIRRLLNGATELRVHQAILLTSELVTNAVLYTESSFTLFATFHAGTGVLRVEIADNSPHPPQPRGTVPIESVGGRGLGIVASMASRWGVEPTKQGKTVWFELGD